MCPAQPASLDSVGSSTGAQSHGPEPAVFQTLSGPGLGDFQIQLLSSLIAHTQEMRTLTLAIRQLAQSNEALIQAMAEGDGMDDSGAPEVYMDGRPVR